MNAGYLKDVSCTGPGTCFAVGGSSRILAQGRFAEFQLNRMFIVKITGSVVATTTGPLNSGGSALVSIRCVPGAGCVATGTTEHLQQFAATETPILVHWDGHYWTRNAAQLPAGLLIQPEVTALGCFPGGGCEGVNAPAHTVSLAGTAWTSQPLPPLAPGESSQVLFGGACSVPTQCFAVGEVATAAGGTDALIEHWNGVAWKQEHVS